MANLEKVKKVIKDNFEQARLDIFFTRNIVGDRMENIYNEDGVQIDICRSWCYFEVFGLTEKEQEEVRDYFYKLYNQRAAEREKKNASRTENPS